MRGDVAGFSREYLLNSLCRSLIYMRLYMSRVLSARYNSYEICVDFIARATNSRVKARVYRTDSENVCVDGQS